MNEKQIRNLLNHLNSKSQRLASHIANLDQPQRERLLATWVAALRDVPAFNVERVVQRWEREGFPWADDMLPELRGVTRAGADAPDSRRTVRCPHCRDTGSCMVLAQGCDESEPTLRAAGCDCPAGDNWQAYQGDRRFEVGSRTMVRVPFEANCTTEVEVIAAAECAGANRWAEFLADKRRKMLEQREATPSRGGGLATSV